MCFKMYNARRNTYLKGIIICILTEIELYTFVQLIFFLSFGIHLNDDKDY